MTVALTPLAGGQANAQAEAGRVENVRGQVVGELGSPPRELVPEAPVFVQERVSTGPNSAIGLRLGRSTQLRLGENARITLDRFLVDAGGVITLDAGPMLLDRTPGLKPIQIRSAFGMISVRGTQIFAGPSQGVFGVFVIRGQVDVTANRRRVILTAGQGTNLQAGAPPTPPARWSARRVNQALASVN